MNLTQYYHLARFHKPIGIILLWSPTAWALCVANRGQPPLKLIVLFFLGTVFMRAAGCIINDIADRQIDLHVKRTQNRPLTAGQVTLYEAGLLLIAFLFASFLILLQLPTKCIYYAVIALVVTIIYPFCKRIIQGPQLILGLAFSLSIPMVFIASNTPLDESLFYLLLINYAWIVAYDTQYAMVDRQDDVKIGIKSTAILFDQYDCLIIMLLQGLFHLLWLPLAFMLHLSTLFYVTWVLALCLLVYQQWLIKDRDEEKCLKAFSSNGYYGLLLCLGLILGF